MLSLPSLAPQDSHSIWYTSSSINTSQLSEATSSDQPAAAAQNHHAGHSHRRHLAAHRHPLARLRLDEEYIERRKQNVQNYGNSWIKPPGIPKSLYQLREEKREMEEHQEALRREALAQELAEAEVGGVDTLLQGEGMDGGMEEARDLDDDVPEAETTQLEADEPEEESDNDDLEQDEAEEIPRGILASRVPDDVYREALVRGEEVGATGFGDESGSTIDGDESQMLQEEDLVQSGAGHQDMDMGMDADLDADIPEAAGYEHTDTEAELSSSDEDDESVDAGVLPHYQPSASMVRSDGTQNSLDLSSMLSNGSSQVGSSPRQRSARRARA